MGGLTNLDEKPRSVCRASAVCAFGGTVRGLHEGGDASTCRDMGESRGQCGKPDTKGQVLCDPAYAGGPERSDSRKEQGEGEMPGVRGVLV